MSARTTSWSLEAARCTASNTTELGSPPSDPRTMSASARDAHMASCSPAAARKVSPAASRTLDPEADRRLATLPTVVVLPTPFTPTNSQTSTTGHRRQIRPAGRRARTRVRSSADAVGAVSMATRSAFRASTSASGSRSPRS